MPPPTIVVVEDDRNIAQLLGFIFQREGFSTRVLYDGRAAQEYVDTHPPVDAVVLDIMLPYRDGFMVAEAIRRDPRWGSTPILMLTGRGIGVDVERARSLGVSEYVVKPFQPLAIVRHVRALLSPAVT